MEFLQEIWEMEKEIQAKLAHIESLRDVNQKTYQDIDTALDNLRNLKTKLKRDEIKQSHLSERNKTIKEKFSILEECVRTEASIITEESKNFFKLLNIRASISPFPENENLLLLKIEFLEKDGCFASFACDPLTHDFDLLEIKPDHRNFNQMKSIIRDTGDMTGFLCSFRKYVKASDK